MAERKLNIVVGLINRTRAGLAGLIGGLGSLRSIGAGISSAFGSAWNTIVAGARRSMMAIGGLSLALGGLLRQYGQQEQSEQNVAAALKNRGYAVESNLKRYIALASEIQRTTKYSDDEVLSAVALGINMGIAADKIEDVTKASVGLAAAYNKDLAAAMFAMGKASNGQITALQRLVGGFEDADEAAAEYTNRILGINQKNSGGKSGPGNDPEQFGKILKTMSGKYSLAQDQGKGLTNWAIRQRNQIGEIFEGLGNAIFLGLSKSGAIKDIETLLGRAAAFFQNTANIDRWSNQLSKNLTAIKQTMAGLFDPAKRAEAIESIVSAGERLGDRIGAKLIKLAPDIGDGIFRGLLAGPLRIAGRAQKALLQVETEAQQATWKSEGRDPTRVRELGMFGDVLTQEQSANRRLLTKMLAFGPLGALAQGAVLSQLQGLVTESKSAQVSVQAEAMKVQLDQLKEQRALNSNVTGLKQ